MAIAALLLGALALPWPLSGTPGPTEYERLARRYFVAQADGTAVPPAGPIWIPAAWLTTGLNTLTIFDEHGHVSIGLEIEKIILALVQGKSIPPDGPP